MFGLLRKDVFNLSSQLKIYLFFPLMAVAFCIWQKNFSFTQVMISILIIFVPLSAFAYDEMSNFNTYALTLPVTKKQIVLSKYMLSLILTVVVMIVATLIGVIISALPLELKVENWEEYLAIVVIACLAMNFVNCVMLPLMFRFGSEKARVMLMIIFFGIGGLGYLVNSLGMNLVEVFAFIDGLSAMTLILGAVGIALVIECISIQVSTSILNQKEF